MRLTGIKVCDDDLFILIGVSGVFGCPCISDTVNQLQSFNIKN